MKKLIALILALSAAICSIPISTSAIAADEMWTGEHTWNGAEDGTGVDYAEALYFEEPPTIDGYVSKEEWGERTLEFHSDFLWKYRYEDYLFNSALFNHEQKSDSLIWLRWDENYFYVAALVRDYDGHYQKRTKDDLVIGDSLAFRIDHRGSRYINYYGNPWAEEEKVPEFYVAHTSLSGGYTDVYDNTNDTGLLKNANPVFSEVLAVVAPSEDYDKDPVNYSDNSMDGYTTYEIAIPWKYIFQNDLVSIYSTLTEDQKKPYTLQYKAYDDKRNKYGGIGYKLGMSLYIINANELLGRPDGGIGWGTGIDIDYCGELHYSGAGSNQVTLVADKVEQKDYVKYNPSVLDKSIKKAEYDHLFYDYLNGDTALTSPLLKYDQLSSLTYDQDSHLQYWGSADLYQGSIIDVGGEHGKVLNYDRVLKSYIDSNDNIHEAGVDPIEQFYIDTSISWHEAYRFPLSYTLDLDVMYTSTDMVEPERASELGNWFGGKNSYEYYCGYDFEERAFIIRESFNYDKEPLFKAPYELEKDTWYNWKFQYDDDSCTARLYINNEQIFDVQNKYFKYTQDTVLENGCLLIWWFINTQIKMDNVKMYNFYDFAKEAETPIKLYGIKGYVHSARSNNGSKEPIYINIYKENSDEVFRTIKLSKSGSYEIPNLLEKNYRIEVSQKECITMSYELHLDDKENTLNVILTNLYDIDFDGFITSSDALKLKKYFAKLVPESDISLVHSDVCKDGVLNAKDLLQLRKRLAW